MIVPRQAKNRKGQKLCRAWTPSQGLVEIGSSPDSAVARPSDMEEDIDLRIRRMKKVLLYDAYYCTIFGGAEFCRFRDSILRFETISTYWGKH